MARDYAIDVATAVQLITEFGGPASLIRKGTSTLGVGGVAVKVGGGPEAVTVVRAQAEASRMLRDTFESGTVFIMAPVTPPPASDNELIVLGETWTLGEVKTIQPASVPLVHLCSATHK